MNTRLSIMLLGAALLSSNFLIGCGTTGGNPEIATVQINSGTYVAKHWFELIPSAQASVSNFTLCFKRIRFKTEDSASSGGSGNIDFTPGEVTLATTGNLLGTARIASGVYRRVEFDLEPNCPGSTSGYSVQLSNNQGTFTSTSTITIKFEGTFTLSSNGQMLNLLFQNITTALNSVSASSQIKTKLEDPLVAGSF